MKKFTWTLFLALVGLSPHAQELYVFSEPASNMPAHSLSTKLSTSFGQSENGERMQRITPELMFGFNKKFMLHTGLTFSNMTAASMRFESVYLYGKYRFLSVDDVHRHFRMAAFAEATHSRNRYAFDEVSIAGDRSGVQAGIIATQLINKFAVSGTVSHTQAMDRSRFDKVLYTPERNYQSLNYSLSAGLLLLPKEYTSYDQLNLNIYAELLGQRTLDRKTYFVDLAPAVQLIFNSNTKLNLGHRFQLSGNQWRPMEKSYYVSVEHTFFNALRKKKR